MSIFLCSLTLLVFNFIASPIDASEAKTDLATCQSLEQAGKFDEALAAYRRILSDAPSEEAYIKACSLLGKLHKYEEADKLLKQATRTYPKNVSLLNLSALIAYRLGKQQEAIENWKQVMALDPKNSLAADWLAKLKSSDTSSNEAGTSGGSTANADVQAENEVAAVASAEANLSLEEQQKLAEDLYKQMRGIDEWEVDKFEELHRSVIEKCPDTDKAIESCWRLSNLYLMSSDEPRYDKAIEVLEHLIAKYPDSPIVPEAKNRLLLAYKEAGHPDKVAAMYQELFKLNPNPDDRTFMIWALEYADALAATGKKNDADTLYQQIIERDNGKDQLEARAARARLNRK